MMKTGNKGIRDLGVVSDSIRDLEKYDDNFAIMIKSQMIEELSEQNKKTMAKRIQNTDGRAR